MRRGEDEKRRRGEEEKRRRRGEEEKKKKNKKKSTMSQRRNQLKTLPESLKACKDGWNEEDLEDEAFEVIEEDDFLEQSMGSQFRETFDCMAKTVDDGLTGRGIQVTNTAIFSYLAKPFLLLLMDFTNQQLVKDGHPILCDSELLEFMATKHLRSTFHCGRDMAFEMMDGISHKKGFKLMKKERCLTILHSLRGYDVVGRDPQDDDECWMERHNLLRRMNALEMEAFKNTIQLLLNRKNGVPVVDDELIPSRASDVERKAVTNRKAGKEGPVADCIACSQTSAIFGVRLRVQGETEEHNVSELLKCLPPFEGPGNNATITFDRGYGKMNFVEAVSALGANVLTIAATVGSRHPFITDEEVKECRKKQTAKTVPSATVSLRLNPVEDWTVSSTAKLGAEARVDKKVLENGKSLHASVVRYVFDRKAESKLTQFFSSGPMAIGLSCKWIATRKKTTVVKTLFVATKRPSETKVAMESKLKENCHPLTVGQRCADWFLMKSFRLTGTMAGAVIRKCQDAVELDSLIEKDLIQSCLNSWFGRFKSTAPMVRGSSNEVPAALKLAQEDFVMDFCEVGLLQHKECPFLGVSPDGVAMINSAHITNKVACVEIETGVGAVPIATATKVAADHGRVVNCAFNDEVFKKCVPSEHRSQVLHQAWVCGLDVGVCVVSKVANDQGTLLQIVVATVSQNDKRNHQSTLLAVAQPLLGWMHKQDVIDKGFLEDEDFPEWFGNDEQCKDIFKTRSKLFFAHHKKIQVGGSFLPLMPVMLFKHATQCTHNKGKPGLDKNTEQERTIKLQDAKVSFETKYILRLIDAITVNGWRAKQAVDVVKPILKQHSEADTVPSTKQIKTQLWNSTLQDHKLQLAFDLLREMELQKRNKDTTVPRAVNGTVAHTDGEALEITRALDELKRKKNFPVKRNRVQAFDEDEDGNGKRKVLKKLRLRSSETIKHSSVAIPTSEKNKEGRKACALCGKAELKVKRGTTRMCSVCMVPLCVQSIGKTGDACHTKWHTANNLKLCHELTSQQLAEHRAKEGAESDEEGEDEEEEGEDAEDAAAAVEAHPVWSFNCNSFN